MSEYFYPLDGRKHYKDLEETQKDMFQAFRNFNNEIFEKESALPRKVKELIAIGVAHTTQCPYCIESHVKAPRKQEQPIEKLGGHFCHSGVKGRGALPTPSSPRACSRKWIG
jgi:AhpD family alkylhydroperoxidase